MDVRALVGASLVSVSTGGCCGPCGSSHNFLIEGHVLDGDQLNGVFYRAQGDESRLCEEACEVAVQENSSSEDELSVMHSCELQIDPLFVQTSLFGDTAPPTGSTADTTHATGDTAPLGTDTGGAGPGGVVSCTGVWSSLCVGGRLPIRQRPPALRDASVREVLLGFASLERASVTAFRELDQQLARLGAPRALRCRCSAAIQDERRHTQLMLELAGEPPCADPCDPVDVEASAIDIAVHNATEGCVSECWSAVLAQATATGSPSLTWRRVFRRVARDEARHGQLAWDIHAWLDAAVLTPAERAHVAERREAALSALERSAGDQVRGLPAVLGFPAPAEVARAAARFARHVRSHASA